MKKAAPRAAVVARMMTSLLNMVVFLLADAGVDPVFDNLSNLRASREKHRENATTVEPHYSNY